jgi:hypothetical protein
MRRTSSGSTRNARTSWSRTRCPVSRPDGPTRSEHDAVGLDPEIEQDTVLGPLLELVFSPEHVLVDRAEDGNTWPWHVLICEQAALVKALGTDDVDDTVFLIDGSRSLKDACSRHGLDFRYAKHGNRNSIERVFREVKRRTSSFSNWFQQRQSNDS